MKSSIRNIGVCLAKLLILATALNPGIATNVAYADPAPDILDTHFGIAGVETSTIGVGNSAFNSIAIDSSGRIVAGGYSYDGTKYNATVARYTTSGVLDSSFGINGVETSTAGLGESSFNSIAIDSSGRIVAGGYSIKGGNAIVTLLRYTASGVLDSSFGAGGVETSTVGAANSYIYGIAIDSSGRIVAGGTSNNGIYQIYTVLRYTSSGVLDNTFGIGGIVTSAIGAGDSELDSIAIDSSGRIVAGGFSLKGSIQFATVSRYIGTEEVHPIEVVVPPPPRIYITVASAPTLHKVGATAICTSGTFNYGVRYFDGTPDYFQANILPTSFTYNFLVNGQSQETLTIKSANMSETVPLSALPATGLLTCQVAGTKDGVSVLSSSTANNAGLAAASILQSTAVTAAATSYQATLRTNQVKEMTALAENRTQWRTAVATAQANFTASTHKARDVKDQISAIRTAMATYSAGKVLIPAKLAEENAAALKVLNDATTTAAHAFAAAQEAIGYGILLG
jgi:uncharacterized delta-60 repeat protein